MERGVQPPPSADAAMERSRSFSVPRPSTSFASAIARRMPSRFIRSAVRCDGTCTSTVTIRSPVDFVVANPLPFTRCGLPDWVPGRSRSHWS